MEVCVFLLKILSYYKHWTRRK